MKLPWDKQYLKIAFHVVFTIALIYVIIVVVSNIGIIAAALLGLLSKIVNAFSALITAFVIAYLLDPVTDFFQNSFERLMATDTARRYTRVFRSRYAASQAKKNRAKRHDKTLGKTSGKTSVKIYKKRTSGAVLTYLVLLLTLTAFVLFLFRSFSVPLDVSALTESAIVTIDGFNDLMTSFQVKLMELGLLEQLEEYIQTGINSITEFLSNIGKGMVDNVSKMGQGVAYFFLGLVIAFYLLRDKYSILAKIKTLNDMLLPDKIGTRLKMIGSDVNEIFSGYIRGQLTDAFIMSILISVYLNIIGLKFAVLIGIISGISNLIPYVGALVAFSLAVIVALLTGSPATALYAAIGIIVIQQIDGMFIVPRVVGEKVELHPALVLLSLSVGGALFGLPGMIFAIPVVAIIQMFLIRYFNRKAKKSA